MAGWIIPQTQDNWDVKQDITKSILWPYCGKSAGIFKCPGDKSTVKVQGIAFPRVRSMSMVDWVGGRGNGSGGLAAMDWSQTDYGDKSGEARIYRKSSDMIDPGQARTAVFLDERQDSINDGMFVIAMEGAATSPWRCPHARRLRHHRLSGCLSRWRGRFLLCRRPFGIEEVARWSSDHAAADGGR